METATIERDTTTAASIFERAVCLSVTLRRLGVRRKVQLAELKPGVEVDAEAIGVSKELLACPEYDAIRQHDGAIRRFLEKRTSGPALFRAGVYMLSYKILPDVDTELQARLRERADILVPAFLDVYEAAREAARKTLGELYAAEDYPPLSDVRGQFSASTRIFSLGEPAKLQDVDPQIFEREREKAAAQWALVIDESRSVLRTELAELVDHLVERLQVGDDGKKKRFNATLIENLDDFLKTFAARDIANDAELADVVDQARAALNGVTPERLRDSRTTRQIVAEQFAAVKATVDQMVENAPARRFVFDE